MSERPWAVLSAALIGAVATIGAAVIAVRWGEEGGTIVIGATTTTAEAPRPKDEGSTSSSTTTTIPTSTSTSTTTTTTTRPSTTTTTKPTIATTTTTKPTSTTTVPAQPAATIRSIALEHNVDVGGAKGMRVRANVSVVNARGRTVDFAAYFKYPNGEPLKDYNGTLRTSAGDVMVFQRDTVRYVSADWSDLVLAIPYAELHMGSGSWNLAVQLTVWLDPTSAPVVLVSSDLVPFTLTT